MKIMNLESFKHFALKKQTDFEIKINLNSFICYRYTKNAKVKNEIRFKYSTLRQSTRIDKI